MIQTIIHTTTERKKSILMVLIYVGEVTCSVMESALLFFWTTHVEVKI